MRTHLVHLLALTAIGAASPLAAQIEGRVTDDRGRPLSGAEAHLLGGDGVVLGRVVTDSAGAFDLKPVAAGRWVRAWRFGFSPDSVELTDISSPIVLNLTAQPFELDGFEVRSTSSPQECPAADDPVARAEWLALVDGFGWLEPDQDDDPLNDLRWYSRILEYQRATGFGSGLRPLSEVPDARWITSGAAQRGLGAVPFEPQGGSVMLARRRVTGDAGGDGDAWYIAALWGPSAPRLVRPSLVRGAVMAFTEGDVTLCRTGPEGVELRASYRIRGGRLVAIGWRLTTPEPVEAAGGWMDFDAGSPRVLPLPERAYFWHRAAAGRNRHEYRVFGPWFVGLEQDATAAMVRYYHGRGGAGQAP